MEIPNGKIGGDQSAVKEHGENEEKCNQLAPHQVLSGQGIGCGDIDHQADEGAHQSVEDGVPIAHPDISVAEQLFIAVYGKLAGPEPHISVGNL